MTENEKADLAVMHTDIKYIKKGMAEFVTKSRLKPLEWIVYGMASGILVWSLNQFLGLLETAKAFL